MVTYPIGLSPSLFSETNPLSYPSCGPTFLQKAVCLAIPCSALEALLSQIQCQRYLVRASSLSHQ